MFSNKDEELGHRIRELRIHLGLTQNQVATALSVTPGYISNVENGRAAMSLRVLTYFARLTDVTLDSLVGTMEPEYKITALDNEIMRLVSGLSESEKNKLIKTLLIWKTE